MAAPLPDKPEIVALDKIDAVPPAEARRIAARFRKRTGRTPLLVSGVSGEGVKPLLRRLAQAIKARQRAERQSEPQPARESVAAMSAGRDRIAKARRMVVKVGSALLVEAASGEIRQGWLASLAEDIAAARARGSDVIVVSSGAIALGRRRLGLPSGTLKLEQSQAAAAVGQIALANAWQDLLARHRLTAAQVLLTLNDTEQRRHYLNARSTLTTLLGAGAVPVINENDTVATSEIRFGDNDRLAARVSSMMSADCLVLLSDIDGLYTAPPGSPGARLIAEVREITPEIEAMAGKPALRMGSGGMVTKIEAARIALAAGASMVIASGVVSHPLRHIADGAPCTWFLASASPVAARKRWIGGALVPMGQLHIDAGAASALSDGKSLLPAGVRRVEGQFARGDAVSIVSEDGAEIARGLVAYDRADAQKIMGRKSSEIADILGFDGRDEMVHRDDLVLTGAIDMADDAATSDLLALGAAARAAQGALALASTERKNAALGFMAVRLRRDAAAVLMANAGDVARASSAGRRNSLHRPPDARRRPPRGHGAKPGGHRRPARSGRPDDRRVDPSQRPGDRAGAGADRRDRRHLRKPPQRHGRRRRPVHEVGQRRHPARRLGQLRDRRGHRRRAAGRARRSRLAARRHPDVADRRPATGSASCWPGSAAPSISSCRAAARAWSPGCSGRRACRCSATSRACAMSTCTPPPSLGKAVAICLNAKMRRTGVCGAAETILIDEAVRPEVTGEILIAH